MANLTVREHYESSKLHISGAPDDLAPRRERIYRIPIDGVRFGDWHVDEPRYVEADMLANVLVSCDVDDEIVSLTSLIERQNMNTPDFEGRLQDGCVVRIEVTQFADELVRKYMGDLHRAFNPVQARWRADAAVRAAMRGRHVVFYFPLETPKRSERKAIGLEMLSVLAHIRQAQVGTGRVYEPSDQCPLLRRMGVTFTVRRSSEEHGLMQFRPSLEIATADAIVQSAPGVLQTKKSKHEAYSDNGSIPVWLAVFIGDGISSVGLSAIQTLAQNSKELDPEPFERVLIAGPVAGIRIDATPGAPAVYTSLHPPQYFQRT